MRYWTRKTLPNLCFLFLWVFFVSVPSIYADSKQAPFMASVIHKQDVRILQVIVDGKTLNNTKIIACEDCGGMMGDAFMFAELEGEHLKVQFYGGSAWRWSEELVFKLNDRRQLILASVRSTSFHATSPADVKVELKKPKGLVRFEDYDPEKEYSYHLSDLGKR